jgi:hypothetical protein
VLGRRRGGRTAAISDGGGKTKFGGGGKCNFGESVRPSATRCGGRASGGLRAPSGKLGRQWGGGVRGGGQRHGGNGEQGHGGGEEEEKWPQGEGARVLYRRRGSSWHARRCSGARRDVRAAGAGEPGG